jgi:Na+-driven multidrug efflux pump
VGTGALSATEAAKWASIISLMRGFVAILIFAFALSALLGMRGVWLAFPATEFVTMLMTFWALRTS